MKALRISGRVIRMALLVLLLAMLAFQGSGINGLAAPAAKALDVQEGDRTLTWSCGCASLTYRVVFLIDDSGSMSRNDPGAQRIKDANRLVDELLVPLEKQAQVRDVQVAVVHFSNEVTPSSGWRTIPGQQGELEKDINAIPADIRGTKFTESFEAAQELFLQKDDDCTRRSIVLFSDGTPEYPSGVKITGTALTADFDETLSSIQGIPGLDAIYFIRYKDSPWYFNEEVSTHWMDLANTYRLFSPSLWRAPRLRIIPSFPPNLFITEIERAADFQTGEELIDLSRYRMVVEFDGSGPLIKLEDASGQVMLPDGDPDFPFQLGALTQDGQEIDWTEEGDHYRFSLASGATSLNQSEIAASFIGEQTGGTNTEEMFRCSGTIGTQTVEIPVTGPATGLSLVLMPPRDPLERNKPIILPLKLNSDKAITSVDWINFEPLSPSASLISNNDSIHAQVIPVDENNGEYELLINPVGDADVSQGILASVTAKVLLDGEDTPINPRATTTIPFPQISCTYDKAWDILFWPLAILLAFLLAGLLVFRARDAHEQKDYQVVQSDNLRIRKWRFLFVPLSIMLGLLILNPQWCYVIPWWLFLVSLLGLIVVVFPLAHFIQDEKRRTWVLLALLLVAISAVVYVSITIDKDLLWPLVVVLLLTVIGRWYIRPDEQPRSKTEHENAALMRLVSVPACVPYNETVRLPLQFDYQKDGRSMPSFLSKPSAVVLSDILLEDLSEEEKEKKPRARIETIDAGQGKYELVIDPVKYDKGITEIQVQIRASTADLAEERSVKIPDQIITIEFCSPDKLAELEGIGPAVRDYLYENQILTFKQLAGTKAKDLNALLDAKPWDTADAKTRPPGSKPWKMMDAKTWPQQAKLAAIAEEFGSEKDREDFRNFEAYKDWLKDGIEPDERELKEGQRRPAPALPWNGITQFTPLVLHLVLDPGNGQGQTMRLPLQLNRAEDAVQLAAVDWEVQATVLPGGAEAMVTVNQLPTDPDRYELVVGPVTDPKAREVRLSIQACVNGRSIEIYHGKALALQVSAPSMPDNLSDLEGIGATTGKFLNEEMRIFTFAQLALTDYRDINELMDRHGQEMRDAKTWPQQARLAYIARQKGRPEDQRSYEAYKAWLKAGIEPDEHDKDEIERRPEALVWHGTAELTENAYPEIFKRQ